MDEIKGLVYRVRSHSRAWLVEVDEDCDQISALAEFCAEKAVMGYLITSVTRIFDSSPDTPRISVLSSPDYKKAYEKARKERDYLEQKPCPPKSLEELTDRIEYAEWSVSNAAESGFMVPEGEIQLNIGKMSPAGEDFSFSVEGENIEQLVRAIQRYAYDFDEEQHVRTIMDCGGAPSLKDLIDDAASIHEMLNDLVIKLSRTIPGYKQLQKKSTRSADVQKIPAEFVKLADDAGWWINALKPKSSAMRLEFICKCSCIGGDFYFTVEGDTIEQLVDAVKSYHFKKDSYIKHVMSHLRTSNLPAVTADAEGIQQMLDALREELLKFKEES